MRKSPTSSRAQRGISSQMALSPFQEIPRCARDDVGSVTKDVRAMTKKVILLDRDGVINQDSHHYIKSPEEYILLARSCEAIARLTKAGYHIGVATNQSGVARGYYDVETLARIHEKLLNAVHAAGGKIDAIVYCPHHPNEGCACRKPNPGLLYMLAKKLHCRLSGVPFLGDRFSDIQAAQAVGARPILIRSPMTEAFLLDSSYAVPVFDSLYDAVDMLIEHGSLQLS
ncbi:MAG: D-glycero-beta-D-manno-heptose 1,7-bisphosphate 7-phosphatase [Gammaproteobacteria bacterium]|nr:D-glycero-beta-D-manno-heptose 1,7-bisphosphate 7-phosphatase [Gammaproteobacteria bacterium]